MYKNFLSGLNNILTHIDFISSRKKNIGMSEYTPKKQKIDLIYLKTLLNQYSN